MPMRDRRPPGPHPADLALLARLRAGDDAAFAGLVERLSGPLLRLARVYVANAAVAEEVVQETWTILVSDLASFEGRSSLKTWIFRILANRAKTRGIREGRSVPFSAAGDPAADDEPAVDPARFEPGGAWAAPLRRWDDETPEKLMLRRELLRILEAALEELPPGQRAVATLRDLEELESAEVCNILGISETNQRVLLHRARSRLRRALEAYLAGAGPTC